VTKLGRVLGFVALIASNYASAFAQERTQCELHVFPTAVFAVADNTQSYATTSGGVAGAAIGDLLSVKDPVAIENLLKSTLDAETQNSLLDGLNLNERLALKEYQIVFHSPAIDSGALEVANDEGLKESQKIKKIFDRMRYGPRLSNSPTSCYAELRVNSIYYEKTPLTKKLYSWFIFRKFGPGLAPTSTFNRSTSTSLYSFPPSNDNEIEDAKAQLRNAFVSSFGTFLAKVKK
jgi:hypothetical protein